MIITNGVGITTLKNGAAVKQALNAANSTVNKGVYDATLLETVDADLAVGNILQPVNIFGKVGTVVAGVDVSDADAAVGDVKNPKTFYSVAAPIKTGTMPTVAITGANDDYPAGYHAGNVGGLSAIDADLAVGNIKSGVNIFGKVGTYAQVATHDIAASTSNLGSCTTAPEPLYYAEISIPLSSDSANLASLTQNYTAGSLAEIIGVALLSAQTVSTLKLRLYADGVEITIGSYIPTAKFAFMTTTGGVQGSKALSGNKTVNIVVHNYDAGSARILYVVGKTGSSGALYAAGVFSGSVKVV